MVTLDNLKATNHRLYAMNKAPNLHSNFFSSLKQVEKRLKLETPSPSLNLGTDHTSSESLCSPLFLHFDHHNHHQHAKHNSTLESSETPPEFLSNPNDFSLTLKCPLPKTRPPDFPETLNSSQKDEIDEIGLLIKLLGLSDCTDEDPKLGLEICSSCRCGGGFYDKIVGFKGPKCEKEAERLEGWIQHFGGEKIEPLRMAHMLLGKAAFLSGGSAGFEGFEFPSTIEGFLQNDPPVL